MKRKYSNLMKPGKTEHTYGNSSFCVDEADERELMKFLYKKFEQEEREEREDMRLWDNSGGVLEESDEEEFCRFLDEKLCEEYERARLKDGLLMGEEETMNEVQHVIFPMYADEEEERKFIELLGKIKDMRVQIRRKVRIHQNNDIYLSNYYSSKLGYPLTLTKSKRHLIKRNI